MKVKKISKEEAEETARDLLEKLVFPIKQMFIHKSFRRTKATGGYFTGTRDESESHVI